MSRPAPAPLIHLLKAIASQLIVWHHLAFYGPMSDVVHVQWPDLIDWLYEHARLAVQVFLVVGGFLAARSLLPRPGEPPASFPSRRIVSLLWRRYKRLAAPLLYALAAAIVAAAIARTLIDEPSVPQAPTAAQFAANLLLAHDLLGLDALSAGLWYVAIDLHLYLLLVLIVAARAPAARWGVHPRAFALLACGGLMLASLFWFNLDPDIDVWAPYFFGAYGLGVCAQWIAVRPRSEGWIVVLATIVLAALAFEWRDRILVAGLTALALACSPGGPSWVRISTHATVAWLARISYSVFLMHYPVMLIVGAVVFSLWPDSVGLNALGMAGAWALSLGAGALLHHWAEAPTRARTERPLDSVQQGAA